MLPISMLVVVWLPALVGLGWPLSALLRRATGGGVGGVARRTAVAGVLGILVAATAASAVGLAVPVRPGLSVVLLALGWAGVIRRRRTWGRLPRRAWVMPAAVAAVVVALGARGIPWYDTGLYHLQAVAWSADGPLPRGLANLYGPLGYDCGWFAFAAAVEFPLAAGRSCFVANAVVAVLVAMPGVDAIARAGGRRRRRIRADGVVYALALFPLAEYGGRYGMVSSLAPDVLVMSLVPFAAAVWVRSPRNALTAVTLATLAVTVKLSAAPLLLAAVVAAAVGGRRSIRRPRRAGLVVGLLAAAGSVWVVRGVWLSGCPLFPSTVGRLGALPWAVPPADARYAERSIEYWSKYRRDYAAVPPGTPWVAAWLRRVGPSEPVLVPALVLVAGCVGLARRQAPLTPAGRRAAVAAVGLVPAVTFWFAVAPDPRFGIGYLCTSAALVVAAASDGDRPSYGRRGRSWLGGVMAVALCVVVRVDHRLFRMAVVRWPKIPAATLVTARAADGTAVAMPVGDDRVWAAPRPATPDLNPTLRCRTDSTGQIREFDVTRSRVEPRPGDE